MSSGDYGLNNVFEYVELCLDSWDNSGSGNNVFENSTSNQSTLKYSWPQFNFSTKKLVVAGIKVIQAEIPFVFDVITPANNTFIYTVSAVDNLITIPVGTYTGVQLAAQLQVLMQAVSAGFLVTWNSQLLKFAFTQLTAVPWSLTFNSRNTAYSVVGFYPGFTVTAVTGAGSQILSASAAQVTGPYYLYVNSRQVGSMVNFNLPDGGVQAGIGPEICRIPINVGYGSVIFYNDPTNDKFFDFFIGNQFDSMDFYLTLGRDQYQKPLDMKGSPWSLKLGLLCYRAATSDLYNKPSKLARKSGCTTIAN